MEKFRIITLIIIIVCATVFVSGCIGGENSNNNEKDTKASDNYIGEAKALEIYNNRNSSVNPLIEVVSGAYVFGSTDISSTPASSAELVDYEGKKMYKLIIIEGGSTFAAYVDAVTGEILQ